MTLRIVVADDHGVVREGLRALLSAVEEYEVIGTAATGAEAIRAAVTLRPDVLVMDIQMPDTTGIDATREISQVASSVAVLMLTMFDDDESVFAAMRAGALGYVLKGAAPDKIIRAIAAVAGGEAIFGTEVARRALNYLTAPTPREPAFPELTPTRGNARCLDSSLGECPTRRSQPGSAWQRHHQQPHLEHLRQTASSQSGRGDRSSADRRSRALASPRSP